MQEDQQAAQDLLSKTQAKAAAVKARIQNMKHKAQTQIANDELKAHRRAAELKQESQKEANDLQSATTAKVQKMEGAALKHAKVNRSRF